MKYISRFAPSPTGYIHIGNVRSAIFPYLITKQTGGTFILRIEDTDQARLVPGATDLILNTLSWLGLNWDEGPQVGGPNGPYFQTERKAIYLAAAETLISKGRAYPDPTPTDQVQAYRTSDQAQKTPYLFRNHRPPEADLSPADALALFRASLKPGATPLPLRFKSDPKPRAWTDIVMGNLHAGPEVQDDFILLKRDGLPTYNFAHIIDDTKMGINLVMRGSEYLSSTPNYLALYEALDFPVPIFASLPHILAPQGNKKLSKRDGAKSVTDYRDIGILPEAMLNYLACLGWNDGTEQEIYTKEELIASFSLDRIQNSGARFNEEKLLWYSGQWIRKIADEQGITALYSRTKDFWPTAANNFDDSYKQRVLSIIYDRLKTLSDLREMTTYFFSDPVVLPNLILNNKFLKKLSETELSAMLSKAIIRLQALPEENWNDAELQTALNDLLTATSSKPAQLFSLIRLAVSFAPFSPALPLTLSVLGKNTTLSRLSAAQQALVLDEN